MSDLGQVVSYGKEPGLGWILGLSSWGVMIVAAVFSVVALYQDKDSAGFAPDGRRPFHLVAAGGISAVFVIGWVLPFTTTTYVANAPNWTYDATGSNVFSTSCCSLSQILDQSGWQAVDSLATLVTVPLVIHLAVLMRRPLLQSGLLAGVAVALMGTAGISLSRVFSHFDLVEAGMSAAQVRAGQQTGDISFAGGLILHLLAITAIIGLAIWLWPRSLKGGD